MKILHFIDGQSPSAEESNQAAVARSQGHEYRFVRFNSDADKMDCDAIVSTDKKVLKKYKNVDQYEPE